MASLDPSQLDTNNPTNVVPVDTNLSQFTGTTPQPGASAPTDPNQALSQALSSQSLDSQNQTIMDTYNQRQGAIQTQGSANKTLLSNEYQPQIDYAQQQGNIATTGIDESTNGLGPASKLAILSRANSDTRLRVNDLQRQMDNALANNDSNTASQLNDLIIGEQGALTTARQNYLSNLFTSAQNQRQQQTQNQQNTQFNLQNGISQPYYQVGNTIYDASTGLPKYKQSGQTISTSDGATSFSTPQDFYKDAGISSFDQIQKGLSPVGQYTQTGTDVFGHPTYGFVNPYNQSINGQSLDASGNPQTSTLNPQGGNSTAVDPFGFNTSSLVSSTPNSSKVVGGYDLTSYATDPNYGSKVAAILPNIPSASFIGPLAPGEQNPLDQYIQKVAPGSQITASDITQIAGQYNVSPQMLSAILQEESDFGTKGAGAKTLNPGNVGNVDSGATKTYQSLQQGIAAVANQLARRDTTGQADPAAGSAQLTSASSSNLNVTPNASKMFGANMTPAQLAELTPQQLQKVAPQAIYKAFNVSPQAQILVEQGVQELLGGTTLGQLKNELYNRQTSALEPIIELRASQEIPGYNINQSDLYQQGQAETVQNMNSPQVAQALRSFQTVQSQLDILDQLSQKVPRTDVRPLNKILQDVKYGFSNDDQVAFTNAVNSIADELGNAIGSKGNGLTDAKLKFAGSLLDPTLSGSAFQTQLNTVRALVNSNLIALTTPLKVLGIQGVSYTNGAGGYSSPIIQGGSSGASTQAGSLSNLNFKIGG